jgi:hypothetical protein
VFRQIAASVGPSNLIREPAGQLVYQLEALWAARSRAATIPSYPIPPAPGPVTIASRTTRTNVVWDHLIYAYLVENTRCDEIIRRVIFETTHGERFAVPRNATTYAWLRSTEELFYSFGPPLLASTTVSQLRSDPRRTRRNAYFRMFGMDLNHGTDNGGPFLYEKAQVANRDFVSTFETFLRETWRAIEHSNNTTGPNPTDAGVISNLALRLQIMLNERRGGSAVMPNLAREEFSAVAAMSWIHVLLEFDNDVLVDLQALGTSPEERLARLGARVGMPSHAHSHSFFILAPLVSRLLIAIEAGAFSDTVGAEVLFRLKPTASSIREDILKIIDHWSRVTGRNIKAIPVTPSLAFGNPPNTVASFAPSATTTSVQPQSTTTATASQNGNNTVSKEIF